MAYFNMVFPVEVIFDDTTKKSEFLLRTVDGKVLQKAVHGNFTEPIKQFMLECIGAKQEFDSRR